MYIGHVNRQQLNECHVAVVKRFPGFFFRIWDGRGFARIYDAPTTLKWLERNEHVPRFLTIRRSS